MCSLQKQTLEAGTDLVPIVPLTLSQIPRLGKNSKFPNVQSPDSKTWSMNKYNSTK